MASHPQPPFEVFFAAHSGPVLGYLRGLCDSFADAEEVAQETFVAALGGYAGFDGANPRAWILTIARHKATDRHRARNRRPQVVEPAVEISAPPAREEELGEVFALVAELPTKQREAIALRYLADQSYREIGSVMATSEAAARRNVHEAIKKLRQRMEDQER